MPKIRFGSGRKKITMTQKVVGEIRKTQLVTTFGSGAIVDMPDYSVIMASTDSWSKYCPTLHEPNLEKLLKVSMFKEPFVSSSQDGGPRPDTLAFRFPYYHFCPNPNCGKLMPFWEFGDQRSRICANGHTRRNIVPTRFIVGCANGHLEDFPYDWWVHKGDYHSCPLEKRKNALRISFSDQTGGLDSIVIRCTACGATRSMAGCMGKESLRGYRCHGRRPWIGNRKDYNDPEPCDCQMRTLQRGASNVYFPVSASALTIPPWSSKIHHEISSKWNGLESVLSSTTNAETIRIAVNGIFNDFLAQNKCSLDELVEEIMRRYEGNGGDYTSRNLREDEYRVFCMGDYESEDDLQFRIARAGVPDFLSGYIEDVVFVKRLREVLALRGFRRITPEVPQEDNALFSGYHFDRGDCISLSNGPLNWLPAIEMLGEGIFIRLREDTLSEWENAHQENYIPMLERLERSNVGCDNFSPRYVLLHTLSHLLIRQLSLECGYSGASIKERIYSSYPDSGLSMAGILLYTSSSDSDGSLGGLVRKGLPDSFESIFRNMLQEASWCSSDPICIESKAQGFDSLNYAACHACALLPETSCEMRNCLLDRASVTGSLRDRKYGLFGSLLESEENYG